MTTLSLIDFETDEEVEIPATLDACSWCLGTGVSNNGGYDVHDITCPKCKGTCMVLAPNLEECTEAQLEIVEAHRNAAQEDGWE